MTYATAKTELQRRLGRLVELLDVEREDAARRCTRFFRQQLAEIGHGTFAIQLRCLARDQLSQRMPLAKANAFSEAATRQLEAVVGYARQLLEEMEVPFDFTADLAGTTPIDPHEWHCEDIPAADRSLIRPLPPATAKALQEWTSLWCFSAANSLDLDETRFAVARAST